jgi:hypothetical protein
MMSTTIFPIVYAVVIYWAVGLHPESNFFIFIGLFFSGKNNNLITILVLMP